MPRPDEPRFRAELTATTPLGSSLRRLRFSGPELSAFAPSGTPDERVLIEFEDDAGTGHMRSYTVRGWDPDALAVDIDFAVHAGGAAAAWAKAAAPGAPVRLSGATGWWRPAAGARRLLLLADLSALPAAGRIVESLPAGVSAHVVGEVPASGDAQRWVSAAEVTVTWLSGSGNGLSPTALPDALTALPDLDAVDYLWSCGETSASRRIRAHLRRTLGWTTDRYHVMGYWQADKERWLSRYARVEARIDDVTARALASGKSVEEVRDTVDDILAEEGL